MIARIFILISAIVFQSCVTMPVVLDKIKGVQEFFPNDVLAAYFDNSQKEFVLCVIGRSIVGKNEVNERFTVKIPDDISKIKKDDSFRVTKEFQEISPKTISSYKISAYDALVETGCGVVPDSFEKVPVLKAPKDITFQEAATFEGKTIDEISKRNKHFLIVIQYYLHPSDDHFQKYLQKTQCNNSVGGCIILVTVSTFDWKINENNKFRFFRTIAIDTLKRQEEPKKLWYAALPFSAVIDAAITGLFIFTFMLQGMGGG